MPVVTRPDARLHYEVHGERGPWLAFVHGAAGNTLAWWQQVPVFAPRFRCLLLDQRGFGRSTCDAPPDPAAFAGDLLAVLDHAGAERAALVGQSMGGWTALGLAVRAPERVTHLLLSATLAGLADDAMRAELAARHRAAGPPRPTLALADDFVAREPVHTWLFERVAGLNPPIDTAFLAALLQLQVEPPAEPPPFPVHVLAGERDALFPLDLVRRAGARLPGAGLTVVAGAGHCVYWEKPASYNAVLAALLGEPPPRIFL